MPQPSMARLYSRVAAAIPATGNAHATGTIQRGRYGYRPKASSRPAAVIAPSHHTGPNPQPSRHTHSANAADNRPQPSQRHSRMRALLAAANVPWLRPVEQRRVASQDELDARMRAVVDAGGEGLMLQHRDVHYTSGRSDGLLKLKPHDDAEARVVAHLPGRGKYAGMVGALLVEREDGARFRLGSGLSDAERGTPPPLGSLVTYRYNGLTINGLPRFARFMRLHEPPPDAGPGASPGAGN